MYKKYVKSMLDFFVALILLIILAPLFIFISICLYFTNNGSVFFVQERPGINEKIFKIIKFKTMDDKKGPDDQLLSDAERLTKVGEIIRKLSFDEIPQLINVLKGDMSLIGPRPLLTEYLPLYTDREKKRHSVKPGITGWAQINGRNFLEWDQRLELDVYYVENTSFFLDTEIFIKTIKNIVVRKDVIVIPSENLKPLNYYRGKK